MWWIWVAVAIVAIALLYVLLCTFVANKVLHMATKPTAHTLEQARQFQHD